MRIARNILALGIGQLFTWGSSAVLVYLLPHYLSGGDYGRFGVGYTLISFIGPFADLGASSYLLRETSSAALAEAKASLGDALALRLPMLTISSMAGIAVTFVVVGDDRARMLFLVLLPSLIFATIGASVGATLRGRQEMAVCALSDVIGRGVSLGLTVLLLVRGFGAIGVAVAADVGALISLLVLVVALIKTVGLPGPVSSARWRTAVLGGLPFFVSGAAVAFHGRIDVLILSNLANLTVAGWYTVAYNIITIPIFVPAIVVGAFFPAIASVGKTDVAEVGRLTRRCLQLVLLGTLPLSVGISVLSQSIVRVLGYQPEFAHAAPLIGILALHIPVVAANMVIATTLFSMGREKSFMIVMVMATCLDIVLNLGFIRLAQATWHNGAIASSVITVSTEVFILLVGARLLPSHVLGKEGLWTSLRGVIAVAVMGIAVMPFRDEMILVPIAVGAVVYAASVLAFGVVSTRDLRQIWQVAQNRLPLRKTSSSSAATARV